MFCRSVDIPLGAVHHDDSKFRRGFEIDIVNSNTGTSDDSKLFASFHERLCNFRLAAYDQCIVVADDLFQFCWTQSLSFVNLQRGL